MAKYNAAKHSIESDDGRTTLATLHSSVRADKGFEIADWWGGDYAELDELHTELANSYSEKWDMRDRVASLDEDLRNARADLESERIRVADLEAELEVLKLKGKGAAAA